MNQMMQAKITGLSELENRLWRAFREAEKRDMPPRFNPWLVLANCFRLRKLGYLRLHEFYLWYAPVAAFCGIAGIVAYRWLLAVYIVALIPTFFYLAKYVKQFAFEKTNVLGLHRYGFGVAHLPLLIHGVLRQYQNTPPPAAGSQPAQLDKANLASVIKLVKGGHEHGDVSYGFSEAGAKWALGSVLPALWFLYTHAADVLEFSRKLAQTAIRDWSFMTISVLALACIAWLAYSVIFGMPNDKRRKRRYLLVLNTIHEGWPDAAQHVETPSARCRDVQVSPRRSRPSLSESSDATV